MHIIIPMAGEGRRFAEKGYTDPKPLIKVDGKPMIEHVVSLFDKHDRFTFICDNRHLRKTDMQKTLKALAPAAHVIGVPFERKGPVYGILQASDRIKLGWDPSIVCYCDFNMDWNYPDFKRTVAPLDGAIVTYTGFHPHHLGSTFYGYCKVDETNTLIEIREKEPFTGNPMSEHAAAGLYYYKDPRLMMRHFKDIIAQNLHKNGEFYASIPFNLMTREGLTTKVYDVPHFCQWGTAEDLEEYKTWSVWFSAPASKAQETLDDATLRAFQEEFPNRTIEQLGQTHAYWRDYFRKVRP